MQSQKNDGKRRNTFGEYQNLMQEAVPRVIGNHSK
jgi:hypothetical protein